MHCVLGVRHSVDAHGVTFTTTRKPKEGSTVPEFSHFVLRLVLLLFALSLFAFRVVNVSEGALEDRNMTTGDYRDSTSVSLLLSLYLGLGVTSVSPRDFSSPVQP